METCSFHFGFFPLVVPSFSLVTCFPMCSIGFVFSSKVLHWFSFISSQFLYCPISFPCFFIGFPPFPHLVSLFFSVLLLCLPIGFPSFPLFSFVLFAFSCGFLSIFLVFHWFPVGFPCFPIGFPCSPIRPSSFSLAVHVERLASTSSVKSCCCLLLLLLLLLALWL